MNDLYAFTVPVFIKQLGGLKNVLAKAESFAKEKNISEESFLNERLAPDMFPLVKQVQLSSDHAKGATARLAGLEVPKFEDNEKTFAELYARIDKTIAFVQSDPTAMFADAATREIALAYWKGKHMNGLDYLRESALPNFYFHVTVAYCLVRHMGVALGKSDYINGLSLMGEETAAA